MNVNFVGKMGVRANALLSGRHEYRVLSLMLVLLHSALWWNFGGAASKSLMLAHLGLFLIWQPLWRRDLRLGWRSGFTFVLVTLIFTLWLDWWPIGFWLVLLIGIVGGRVSVRRTDRAAYMIALLFLVCELLIGVVPAMFAVHTLSAEITTLFGYGLLVLPAVLFFISGQAESDPQANPIDFLYGLTVALLTSILALGSLLSMYDSGADYAVALLQTTVAIAFFLFAISWLWMPLAGFSGFGQLWTRYLLNVGTPFEQWLGALSQLAARDQTPEKFLASAMEQFAELPWVAGAEWTAGAQRGTVGEATPHAFKTRARGVTAVVYARRQVGSGLLLHGRLLIRLVGDFYRAKQREQELARQAHLRAIHETGARVTHDIKNLLQSLHTVTAAVRETGEERHADLQRLLSNQLPSLTQRLRLALDKLQAPERDAHSDVRLADWWESVRARNEGDGIRFTARADANPPIPVDLFDSVLENLLENARYKRQSEPGLDIEVALVADARKTELTVRDNGSRVDPEVARGLLEAPVHSRSGLGIGLYQAARQASQRGYRLALREDRDGHVCFVLARSEEG